MTVFTDEFMDKYFDGDYNEEFEDQHEIEFTFIEFWIAGRSYSLTIDELDSEREQAVWESMEMITNYHAKRVKQLEYAISSASYKLKELSDKCNEYRKSFSDEDVKRTEEAYKNIFDEYLYL